MKALQIVGVGHPLELHEVNEPQPGEHDILLQVETAGICHSDSHYRAGRGSVAFMLITPGHEIAGTVVEVGSAVTTVHAGERVALHYLFRCAPARRPASATQILEHADARGVNVAMEMIGLASVQEQALSALGPQGRLALVGIGKRPFSVHAYPQVIGREAEIIGVSDHLRSELVPLMEFTRRGALNLEDVSLRSGFHSMPRPSITGSTPWMNFTARPARSSCRLPEHALS